jgi:hypothetical protein
MSFRGLGAVLSSGDLRLTTSMRIWEIVCKQKLRKQSYWLFVTEDHRPNLSN